MLNVKSAQARRRPAFTLIELLVVVAIIALLISILLPSLARARELSKRTVCAANLKGIGTGLYTYGNENNQVFPIANNSGIAASLAVGTTTVKYVNMIGNLQRETVNTDDSMSTVRNFWVLVRDGASAPGSFICPSTDDQKSDIDDPSRCWDFNTSVSACPPGVSANGFKQVSYGYQMPYGSTGLPTADRDQRMALAADQGPYGSVLEKGENFSAIPNKDITDNLATLNSGSTPDQWNLNNSPNHSAGEGQNVLYADSHSEFQVKASVGASQDNIYTQWLNGSPTLDQRVQGVAPIAANTTVAPFGKTDSLIYP